MGLVVQKYGGSSVADAERIKRVAERIVSARRLGHNVVVAKTADMKGIDADGIKAGLASDYVKAGDSRVIAHSKVVGGGESTS